MIHPSRNRNHNHHIFSHLHRLFQSPFISRWDCPPILSISIIPIHMRQSLHPSLQSITIIIIVVPCLIRISTYRAVRVCSSSFIHFPLVCSVICHVLLVRYFPPKLSLLRCKFPRYRAHCMIYSFLFLWSVFPVSYVHQLSVDRPSSYTSQFLPLISYLEHHFLFSFCLFHRPFQFVPNSNCALEEAIVLQFCDLRFPYLLVYVLHVPLSLHFLFFPLHPLHPGLGILHPHIS